MENGNFFQNLSKKFKEDDVKLPLYFGIGLIALFLITSSLAPEISRRLGLISQKKQQQQSFAKEVTSASDPLLAQKFGLKGQTLVDIVKQLKAAGVFQNGRFATQVGKFKPLKSEKFQAPLSVPAQNTGTIRVWKNANSAFDPYTRNDNYADIINARYQGMFVYEPYFDSRLSWYTGIALFYKDAYAIYTDPDRNKDGASFDWILRDEAGSPCYIPWGSPYDQYAADIGNQAFRDNWINYVVNKLNNFSGYEGVFVDDVNLDDPAKAGISRVSCGNANGLGNNNLPIDPRTGQVITSDSWNRYFAEFMEQLRNAIPTKQIAHNSIWYITPFDNTYLLRVIEAANIVQMEQGFIDTGLTGGTGKYSWSRKMSFVDLIHSYDKIVIDRDEDVTNDVQQEYGVANYFLINNGSDFYDPVYRSGPDDPWDIYGASLGSATNEKYLWNGLYRRDFTGSFVLVNPPGGATTTVNLGGTYSDLYGGQYSSITLSERQAKIFIVIDGDGDGFSDSVEQYLGTDPNLKCGDNAWPPDFNNDRYVDITDISRVSAAVGQTVTDSNRRLDLNADGFIDISDKGIVANYFGRTCI